MASTIRLKTKIRNNITTVRAIIRHPMETGFRISDETGKLVPEHNNNIIFSCDWSRAVSKNPYLSFMFENSKVGDKIEIAWFDTEGKNETLETLIQ